jgi:hypothetical protein
MKLKFLVSLFFSDNIDVEGANVEGVGWGPRGMLKGDVKQGKASCSNIDDLYYLELVVESIIPLYESSDLRRFTRTLMILSMCATYNITNLLLSCTCAFTPLQHHVQT